ncbi:MAG: hypothetical protein RJA76_46 [Bacteroidota bacterium]|jgi:hypothetical protein
MDLIQKNPYRTLGLLAGSSAAVQSRQFKRLKQYIEAEEEPEEDYSFPTLGELIRTIDSIEQAQSRLDLDAEKLESALFWFYQGNPITDEPAFDALKLNDEDGAAEIWRNLVIDEDTDEIKLITKRNASAFHNLSTYYLTEYGFDEEALRFKLLFIESEYFKDFLNQITDKTFSINQKDAQILFLSTLFRSAGDDQYDFIETLSEIDYVAQSDFQKIAVKTPLEEIDIEIKETKIKRQANKNNAIRVGQNLFDTVKLKLDLVEILLGENNLTFQSISDKVADEILQCGIEYFSHLKSSSKDPSSESLKLFRIAKGIVRGNITKQRIAENTKNLEDWVKNKAERERNESIVSDLEMIKNLIDTYELKPETIDNAHQLLDLTKVHLLNIKRVLGENDELYLNICTRIASDAQGMCVSEINKLQDRITNSFDYSSKSVLLTTLSGKVEKAWLVTTRIEKMDLNRDFKVQLANNKSSLISLRSTLSSLTNSYTNTGSSNSSNGSTRTNYSPSKSNDDTNWFSIIVLIVIFLIIIKACSS